MKIIKKPLSLIMAVVMLIGVFACVNVSFAANVLNEGKETSYSDTKNTFEFTPSKSGVYSFTYNVRFDFDYLDEDDEYGDKTSIKLYDSSEQKEVEAASTYSTSRTCITVFFDGLTAGKKYIFTIISTEDKFSGKIEAEYAPSGTTIIDNVEQTVERKAFFKFIPSKSTYTIENPNYWEVFYDGDGFSGQMWLTVIDKAGNKIGITEELYLIKPAESPFTGGNYLQLFIISDLIVGEEYTMFISTNDTHYLTFTAKPQDATGTIITSADVSNIPNMKFGDSFPEDPVKIDEKYGYISNVRFVKVNSDADMNSDFWLNASATTDELMQGKYYLCFDLTAPDNCNYLCFGLTGGKYQSSSIEISPTLVACAVFVDASVVTSGGFKYSINSGEATLTSINNSRETEITVPESINAVGKDYNVTGIAKYAINSDVTKKITISKNVKNISPFAFADAESLEYIAVSTDNSKYFSNAGKGILFSKSGSNIELVAYPGNRKASTYDVPASVTSLTPGCFYYSKNLKTVNLSNNKHIKTIGAHTFNHSSLTEVYIPKNITAIGNYAFANTSISKVVFEKGSKLKTLGFAAIGYYEGDWGDYYIDDILTVFYFSSDKTVKTAIQKMVKATSESGNIKQVALSTNSIAKAAAALSKSATYTGKATTYTGKAITPGVVVKLGKYTLKRGTDYTVSYQKNVAVGKAVVTIKGKGFFTGTIKKTFNIIPKGTAITKLAAGRKSFTAKWKKQTTQTTGYQVQYSLYKNFAKGKVFAAKKTTTAKKVSKLAAKRIYYVRIRTYKTVGKVKYYSAWSKSYKVKTK